MLAHSPRLPLTIDYFDSNHDNTGTEEDERGIMLALRHPERVRRIRLRMCEEKLQRLVTIMDNVFPSLEILVLSSHTPASRSGLPLPKTFRAPQLHHFLLMNFAFSIGSPLLTTAAGIVALWLEDIHPSAYFPPNDLIQQLAHLPHLETLGIGFQSPVPNRDIDRELLLTPIATHVTLPNLRWLFFRGVSAYLEALLPRMTAPRLEKLYIMFFNQLTVSVPHLLPFLRKIENLKFSGARFSFYNGSVVVGVYPHEASMRHAFEMVVPSSHLDWQVSSIAQVFDALSPVLSAVERLTLDYEEHRQSSETHNEVDRMQWRQLLGSFSNVKSIHVENGLVRELSRSLQFDDGEPPAALLPELTELSYSASDDIGDAFTSFIGARQDTDHPVTLVRH
ncbi:hypothetical protein BC826DRAFT_1049368 [Russula brevipes]|nr:hypothetical protein BC826DRAFT_1049368 [Russula brevipes]